MESSTEDIRELNLLERIEQDPDITQASLAAQLGVAVGTVNWHLQRLIEKGHVKVKRAQRKKLRYIITPSGIALRTRLTIEYVERSFQLYRKTRARVGSLLSELRSKGFSRVRLETLQQSPDDIIDICRLSCLEQNFQMVEDENAPVVEIHGYKLHLRYPEKEQTRG